MRALAVVSVTELLKNESIRKFYWGPPIKKAEVISEHPSDMFVLWNSGGLSDALRRSAYNAWDTVEGVFGELRWELAQETK
jgi:hypothetical protein